MRLHASTGATAAETLNFLWDINHGLPQLALERNGNNALLRRYTYGLRRLRQAAGTPSYYAYDPLGSVAGLLSNTGAAQRSWSYEPYGTIHTSSGTTPPNLHHFNGEYLDPTGIYHLRARQYDPTVGRFLAVDPIEPGLNQGTWSQYAYAAGRPTVMVDPSGKTMISVDAQTRALQAASPLQSSAQPREKWKSIPRWSNLGIFYGGLFIQGSRAACPVSVPVLAPCLRGDARGFSANAPRDRYRAFIRFDFTVGSAYVRINPTCATDGQCYRIVFNAILFLAVIATVVIVISEAVT